MKSILILNGPNLNLLGHREPEVYGTATLKDVEALCRETAAVSGHGIDFRQSNHEGVLIDALQEAGMERKAGRILGAVFNPGAFTHTSIALLDAIKATELPVFEVHISNPAAREEYRHISWVARAALGCIWGFGVDGYRLAIDGLVRRLVK